MSFQPIHEMVRAAARRYPERVALDCGRRTVSYRELLARADRLSAHLAGAGAAGEVVGIFAEDLPEIAAGMLGALGAGGIFVHLSPALPAARLAAMVEQVAPAWLLVEAGLAGRVAELAAAAGTRHLCLDPERASGAALADLAGEEAAAAWLTAAAAATTAGTAASADPDAACYIYFTSGSSGRAKAIVGRQAGIDHFVRWEVEEFGLGHGPRTSQLTSPSFDAFLRDLFVPLSTGGTSCRPEPGTVLDGRRLADWLDVAEIELVHCVPSLFRSLLASDLNPHYFAALRAVLLSGEPVLPADVGRWWDVFGDRVAVANLYGPSETTMTKFCHRIRGEDRDRRSVPIGKPMPGARAVLVDRAGQAAPPGAVGEIYIRTAYRSLGYWRDPERTAQGFVQNPFSADPGDVVYRTGDFARMLDDGSFEFLGRTDQQVKIRGVRVELPEIESQLLRHPAVADAAVADRADATGTRYLCAYLVTREPVTAAALKEFLLTSLPEALVPSAFAFMSELPRTLTGKLDRQALPSAAQAGGDGRPYLAPRSRTEERLAAIWTALLGLPRAGLDESFFELGGHSLLATQLLSRVRDGLGVELPLHVLFDAPTLEAMAAAIDGTAAAAPGVALPPLVPVPRGGPLPLSFSQERLWFLDQLAPGNPAYNVPQVVDVRGPLHVGRFRASLSRLAARHESLRTTFPAVDGRPVQRIAPAVATAVPVVDLARLPQPRREPAAWQLAGEEVRRRFELGRGPLLRARLLRLAGERHLLVLTIHHIISDDWSRTVLTRDWTALYAAEGAAEPAALPPLPVQVADHACWQRQWMSGDRLAAEIAFWRERLGTLPVLDLPTDRPRPLVASHRGAGASLTMPAPLAARIAAVCRAEGVTLFMFLIAAYQLLLGRYARQDRVAVGTPVAGRTRAELEDLVGFFVNTLVVAADLGGDPTWRELLRQMRRLTLDALEHQEVPFEKIVEALAPERSRSHAPLFQVVFAMQNAPSAPLAVGGLDFTVPYVDTGAVKADLDLDVVDTGAGLFAGISYAVALFDAATVRRLLGHLEALLEHAAADPDRRLSELELLSGPERHQLLRERNDTAAPVGAAATLHELVAARAARHPGRTAVVAAGGELTYAELDRRANQLARELRQLGVGCDTLVGLCVERSLDFVVALLGIGKAGGAFLALDPAYPMARLAWLMRDAQVAVLVTAEALAHALPTHWGPTVFLDAGRERLALQDDATPPPPAAVPESAAYVIYTSGSTGRPKGVVVPHRGLPSLVAAQRAAFGLGEADRVLQFSSSSFDAAVFEVLLALGAGATLVLGSRDELMPGAPLLGFLERHRITAVTLPPSALGATPPAALPALATITVAGEACPRELVAAWAPGRRFWNLYGPTEATIWSSACRCAPGPEAPTLGRPIANARLVVADRAGRPAPAGVPGELWIGGPGLARGYLGQPALTAERFVPDPWGGEAGARLYRSGDLVRVLASGELAFLGRLDDQVKVRGFRIETREVELALAAHPAVLEAAVVAQGGGAERRLVAYLAPRPGARPLAAELRQALAARLPEFMIPSQIVVLERLPRLPSGKLDRAALPAPDRAGGEPRARRPPGTPVEEVLAGIWREVLGSADCGPDDDFFELGGHSLAATQVLSRIAEVFGAEVPLAHFFAGSTLGNLAAEIAAARRTGAAAAGGPIPRLPRDGGLYPLSLPQEQAFSLYERAPAGAADHVPAAFALRGPLRPALLAAALSEVVRRHEPLRTTFPVAAGQRRQRIHPPAPLPLPLVDLAAAGPDRAAARAQRLVAGFVAAPFDLERGPLLRARLLRLAADEHVLALVCHHLIADQWSAGIFSRELSRLYTAAEDAEPATGPAAAAAHDGGGHALPELALQYVDLAVWQRRALAGEALDRQLAYWRERLAGARPVELPARTSAAGAGPSAVVPLALPSGASAALRALAREMRATPFMALLAAFKATLAGLTGQHDLVVRAPVANRGRPESEPLIGFFPNELVLRTDLGGDPSYLELLARVREGTLAAYLHQEVPFEAVSRALAGQLGDVAALMRVTCNYYRAPTPPLALAHLTLTPLAVGTGLMRRHLMLLLEDGAEGIDCSFHYRADLLDADFVARLAARFGEVVAAVAGDPSLRLSALGGDRSGWTALAAVAGEDGGEDGGVAALAVR